MQNCLFQVSKRPILYKRNEINRAQGIAVYIRSGCSASHMAIFECRCHVIQIIKLCDKHNNFHLFSVCWNPDANDGIFFIVFWYILQSYKKITKRLPLFLLEILMPVTEWLNSVSQIGCHGLRPLDFSSESGCDQIIDNPTHKSGNCLDLIFTDTPGVVVGNGSPVGTSLHCFVSAAIKTEHTVSDISFSRKIYLESQADWDLIVSDLHEFGWADIHRQVDFVASMNDAFERNIRRSIPSQVTKFRIKDKA